MQYLKTLNYATEGCPKVDYFWDQEREAFTSWVDATHRIRVDKGLDCIELDLIFHEAHKEIRHESR